ncbi:MAG: hypothetical protein P1Q69_16120 [Candidatus Thorarchaeota archaeon]|nr:hypothetical protein [Candidatus Thorarchaeota archaeon]
MMNESEASKRLQETFFDLEVDKIIKETPASCIFNFHEVDRAGNRSCIWEVKDSILHVEVHDTDVESGVRMVVSTFVRLSLENDPRIIVRNGYLPPLLILLQIVGTTLALFYVYIQSMNELAILLGIYGLIGTPILLWWNHKTTLLRDEEFIQRIAKTSSTDPLEARQLYSPFISGGSLLEAAVLVLACEFIFAVFTLFPILFPA